MTFRAIVGTDRDRNAMNSDLDRLRIDAAKRMEKHPEVREVSIEAQGWVTIETLTAERAAGLLAEHRAKHGSEE